jgi:hypothetical protein
LRCGQAARELGDWSLLDVSKFHPRPAAMQHPKRALEAPLLSCTLAVFDAALTECDALTSMLQEVEGLQFDIGDRVEVVGRGFGIVVGTHLVRPGYSRASQRRRLYDVVSWYPSSLLVWSFSQRGHNCQSVTVWLWSRGDGFPQVLEGGAARLVTMPSDQLAWPALQSNDIVWLRDEPCTVVSAHPVGRSLTYTLAPVDGGSHRTAPARDVTRWGARPSVRTLHQQLLVRAVAALEQFAKDLPLELVRRLWQVNPTSVPPLGQCRAGFDLCPESEDALETSSKFVTEVGGKDCDSLATAFQGRAPWELDLSGLRAPELLHWQGVQVDRLKGMKCMEDGKYTEVRTACVELKGAELGFLWMLLVRVRALSSEYLRVIKDESLNNFWVELSAINSVPEGGPGPAVVKAPKVMSATGGDGACGPTCWYRWCQCFRDGVSQRRGSSFMEGMEPYGINKAHTFDVEMIVRLRPARLKSGAFTHTESCKWMLQDSDADGVQGLGVQGVQEKVLSLLSKLEVPISTTQLCKRYRKVHESSLSMDISKKSKDMKVKIRVLEFLQDMYSLGVRCSTCSSSRGSSSPGEGVEAPRTDSVATLAGLVPPGLGPDMPNKNMIVRCQDVFVVPGPSAWRNAVNFVYGMRCAFAHGGGDDHSTLSSVMFTPKDFSVSLSTVTHYYGSDQEVKNKLDSLPAKLFVDACCHMKHSPYPLRILYVPMSMRVLGNCDSASSFALTIYVLPPFCSYQEKIAEHFNRIKGRLLSNRCGKCLLASPSNSCYFAEQVVLVVARVRCGPFQA